MKQGILPGLLAAFCLALPTLRAQETFETAPTFRASDLLPRTILENPSYTIDPTVPTDGLLGTYQLRTAYGVFECRSLEMLHTRLHELRALEEIEKLSKSQAFLDAAKAAALKPVAAVGKMVSDPVGTVKGAPKGVSRLFGKVVKGVGDAGKSINEKVKAADAPDDGQPKPPAERQDPFGYNQARNDWARQFDVDPYTSNEVLAEKLNHLGMLTFGTQAAAGFGIGAVAAPLSMVSTVDSLVLTQAPAAVRETNARKLAALGIGPDDAAALLQNRWFTPTLQTRFVNAVLPLGKLRNVSAAVALAGDVQSEDEARFLCRGMELLGRFQVQTAPLQEFHPLGRVPAASATDGSLVIAAPVDVIAWTPLVADFVAQMDRPDNKPVLCTNARLSKKASAELTTRGWSVIYPKPPGQMEE